ncbi:EpsG family protein [Comamonas fluminis]|uniref:EpsG family protein n=1 Tax=Comamonas fluminis TaxID=2796366 RepID=UPI001C441E65|nr:EpsG family protein [Comamonas fluminis]
MYQYFIVLLFIYIISFARIKYGCEILFFLLFLFSAIRFDVGFDFDTYYHVITGSNFYEYERFGFIDKSLIDFTNYVGINQLYFFITSFFTVYLIIQTIKKYSDDVFISIIVFYVIPIFYLYSFSLIRQFIAVAIIFYSIEYVLHRRLFRFFICITIASMFHISALVAFPIYILRYKKIPIWIMAIMFVVVIFLPAMGRNLIDSYIPYYSIYLDSSQGHGWTMMYLMLFFLGFSIVNRKFINNEKDIIIYNSYLVGVFLYCLFIQFGEVAPRISFYYLIFLTLLIPSIVFKCKSIIIKISVFFCFAILFVINFYFFDKNEHKNPYLPYQTFIGVDVNSYNFK